MYCQFFVKEKRVKPVPAPAALSRWQNAIHMVKFRRKYTMNTFISNVVYEIFGITEVWFFFLFHSIFQGFRFSPRFPFLLLGPFSPSIPVGSHLETSCSRKWVWFSYTGGKERKKEGVRLRAILLSVNYSCCHLLAIMTSCVNIPHNPDFSVLPN